MSAATCSGCGRTADLEKGGLPVGWEWTLAGEVIRDYGTFENWLKKHNTDATTVLYGVSLPVRPLCASCADDS